MAATNLTIGVTQTKAFEDLICSASLYCRLQQLSTSLSALNILLSFTAFFGNFFILVALQKESTLHPPSQLFYRCLATTDLLVGLLVHPLSATHWMSTLHEKWRICRYTFSAWHSTGCILCSVSLLTMTAISVDRLLALLLRLRCRQVVILRRLLDYIWSRYFKWSFWLHYNVLVWLCQYDNLPDNLNGFARKDFPESSSS